MITRLHVDNYKCLEQFELPLGELALLLGLNGAGKSSVFDLVYAVRELLAGTATVADVFAPATLTRWQPGTTQVVECGVKLGDDDLTYHLEVEHDLDARRSRILVERLAGEKGLLFDFVQGEVTIYRDDHVPGPRFPARPYESALARVAERKEHGRILAFLGFMQRIVVCGLYPRAMAGEAFEETPVLARDGANFASWCRHAFQEHQDLVPAYLDDMRQAVDGLTGIRLERLSTEARAFLLAFARDAGKFELRLDEISDGERALLALYALIRMTAGGGTALFLDEPDNYVALPELQPWLLALKDEVGGPRVAQAVLSSHHPELIDSLGVQAGAWITRERGGPARVRPVAAPADGPLKLSELVARGWQP